MSPFWIRADCQAYKIAMNIKTKMEKHAYPTGDQPKDTWVRADRSEKMMVFSAASEERAQHGSIIMLNGAAIKNKVSNVGYLKKMVTRPGLRR